MGSLAPDTNNELKKREIHVLVTGFGPFLNNEVNPSSIIANALPDSHIWTTKDRPSDGGNGKGSGQTSTFLIHIHKLEKAVEVSYDYVDNLIPKILFGSPDRENKSVPPSLRPKYDIILNLGLASGRIYYAIESKARREGYYSRDVDGKLPASSKPAPPFADSTNSTTKSDEQPPASDSKNTADAPAVEASAKQKDAKKTSGNTTPPPPQQPSTSKEATSSPSLQTPAILTPTYDMSSIHKKWIQAVGSKTQNPPSSSSSPPSETSSKKNNQITNSTPRLELSSDAGLYLCEYTLYACLAEYWKYNQSQNKDKTQNHQSRNNDTPSLPPSSTSPSEQQPPAPKLNNENNTNATNDQQKDQTSVDSTNSTTTIPTTDTTGTNQKEDSKTSMTSQNEGSRPCFFLHVPVGDTPEDIKVGVQVTLGLLEAIVDEVTNTYQNPNTNAD